VLVASLAGLELADRLLELRDRPCEEPRQLARGLGDGRDAVQVGRVGDLLDVVEDVVQTGCEGVDIFVVEGGDEGPVEGAHDLVGDLVAPMLESLDLPLTRRKVPPVSESLFEQASRTDDRRSLLFEEVVEATLAGDEGSCPGILAQEISQPPTRRRRGSRCARRISHLYSPLLSSLRCQPGS
jgi:hypothetical protein